MNRFRTPISALFAIGVTFGLFLFMFKLISSGGNDNEALDAIAGIHFGPVDIPDDVMTKNRRIPKKPPPPKNPPPPPKMQISKMEQTVQNMPNLDLPDLDVPMVGGEGMFIGNFASVDKTEEGDIIPVEMPDHVVLRANGVPMFRTNIGISNGNIALKIHKFYDKNQ